MLSWIEINSKHLAHNIEQFKRIAPRSQIWPVIKSNAYGHGLKELADLLDKNKNVDGLMMVNLTTALELRKFTIKPIMVLSYFDKDENDLREALDKNISLPIYDLETADYLNDFATKESKKFLVNIKIDTGAARLGFRVEEAERAIEYIKNKKSLIINTIFTHYAESESEDKTFTQQQLDSFNTIVKKYPNINVHSACSASAISLPQSQMDIIRLGISLYGLWSSEATEKAGLKLGITLKPVMSWKTRIIQIKNLDKGESVGYDRTYICKDRCRIAVLPIGYNEGYSRLLSNKAEVLIKGGRYPVRGNICMNLTMVELDLDSSIKVGEIVTLLGRSQSKFITAEELAKLSKTINYEVVTKIDSSLPRVII